MKEKLPILHADDTRALLRRGKKNVAKRYGKKNTCYANRAADAAEFLATFGELTHEQRFLFVPFIANVAAEAYGAGYSNGLRAGWKGGAA